MKIGFRIPLLILTIWQALDLLQVAKCASKCVYLKASQVYRMWCSHTPFGGVAIHTISSIVLP